MRDTSALPHRSQTMRRGLDCPCKSTRSSRYAFSIRLASGNFSRLPASTPAIPVANPFRISSLAALHRMLHGRRTIHAARNKKQPRFLSSLIAEFQEIPLFLRHSLSTVAGLSGSLSARCVLDRGQDGFAPSVSEGRRFRVREPAPQDSRFLETKVPVGPAPLHPPAAGWNLPLGGVQPRRQHSHRAPVCGRLFSSADASEWRRCGSGWRGHGALPPASITVFCALLGSS